MSGPGGRVIARVSVRVVPDTRGFKAEVENQLRQIRDATVNVHVNFVVDRRKLEAQLAAIQKDLNIKVDFQVDQAKLAAAKAAAQRPIEIKAKVDPDLAGIARIKAELTALNKSQKLKLEPVLGPTESLESAIGRLKPFNIRANLVLPDRSALDNLASSFAPGILGATRLGSALNTLQTNFTRLRQVSNTALAAVGQSFSNLGTKVQGVASRIGSVFTPHIAKIRQDFDHLRNAASLVTGAVGSLFGGMGDRFRTVGSSVGRALGTVGTSLGNLGSLAVKGVTGLVSFAGALATAGAEALGMVAGLLRVVGLAALVGSAGAAITAAWGAASTAIAAVPAAIALIGVPIAAIALGMDGIKKAAKALEPAFKSLKTAVSATFEKGLKPIFEDLAKNLMPSIQEGMVGIAQSLVGVTKGVSDFLTSSVGLNEVETLFTNVKTAISGIDLVPLVDGFLRLAGNEAALKALTDTVNGLGTAIQSIADNPALNTAFEGLGSVIGALERAFTSLVNNGIELFAAAAPGITTALDGITAFFDKFDWDRLGAAVGGAFKGIGDAIKNINPGTVESITQAFEGLSTTLQSGEFAAGIQAIADTIPVLIGALDLGAQAIASFGEVVLGWQVIFAGAGVAIGTVTDALGLTTGAADKAQAALDRATQKIASMTPALDSAATSARNANEPIAQFAAQILRSGGDLAQYGIQIKDGLVTPLEGVTPPAVAAGGGMKAFADSVVAAGGDLSKFGIDVNGNVVKPVQQVPEKIGAVGPDIASALNTPLTGMVTDAQATVEPLPTLLGTALDPMASIIGEVATKSVGLFGTGLGQLSPELQAKLGILPGQAQTELAPLGDATTTGVQGMVDAANAAIPGLGTAFQTGFTSIQGLATTAFTALNTQFVTFGAAITALNTQFLAFGTTITAFGTNLGLVTSQFTLLGTGLTLLNASLITFGTSFTTINASIITFNASLTLLNQGFTLFQTQLVLVNASLLLFGQAFLTINASMIAFGAALTAVNTSFTTFGTALTTANASLLTFGQALTTAGQAATTFGQAVVTAFQQAQQAITTGMTGAVQAVQQGFTDMVAAATQGGADIVQQGTDMMTQFVEAVTTGMADSVAAVEQGLQDIIAAIPPDTLHATGLALMQGLADGITEGSSIVQDAVRKVVADAKAAADQAASVNSPSRLFRDGTGLPIAEGIAVGITDGTRMVEDAAAESVYKALEAAQRAVDTAGQLNFNSAFADASNSLTAKIASELTSAKAQILNATIPITIDGKVISVEVQEIVGQWEKDILSGVRQNGGFGGRG